MVYKLQLEFIQSWKVWKWLQFKMVLECIVTDGGFKVNKRFMVLRDMSLWESEMVLACIGVNDCSDSPELHRKVFGKFSGFCKLLRVGHHLKNLVYLALSLQGTCCAIFYQMLAWGGWLWKGAMCLLGRFLSHLVDVGSMGHSLKSACRYFIGGAVNSVLKVGVDGISGSTGSASGRRLEVV